MGFKVGDNNLKNTTALPNGATNVKCAGFDLGHGSKGDHLADVELEIQAPALATGVLGDGATMIFAIYHDTASDFSGETLLVDRVIVQTGAGGAGAAAQTLSARLPVDVKQYVRVRATNSAAGNASGSSMVTRLVF